LRLAFNDRGEIEQTVAERPRLEAEGAVTPWVGVYGGYEEFGGVLVPTRGEVRWELPEGAFTYCEAGSRRSSCVMNRFRMGHDARRPRPRRCGPRLAPRKLGYVDHRKLHEE
jgi:hypothetical protein